MTINELKAIIKLGHGDRIVVLNDNEEIVEAIKDYKNGTRILLARTGSLVSIQTHKYDKPTPLGNHLVKKCISILSDNGYDAYIDESEDINTYLQITWD